MPLLKGKRNVGRNISRLIKEKKPRDQAVAIALEVSRRKKKRRG